ncbi:unnamed protein product [Linum trigynum]|uniref:Uncharacterized protein n=1 Tax=Linum trigynum TaxID=586398 RepID=A0AAV2CAA6_9ROSI
MAEQQGRGSGRDIAESGSVGERDGRERRRGEGDGGERGSLFAVGCVGKGDGEERRRRGREMASFRAGGREIQGRQ